MCLMLYVGCKEPLRERSDPDLGRLAAIWPDVYLPPDLATEEGPEPDDRLIRGVDVDDLAATVARSSSRTAETRSAKGSTTE